MKVIGIHHGGLPVKNEFGEEIISDKGVNTFLEKGHGFLAYDAEYTTDVATSDVYIKSAVEVRNSYTDKFTNWSNDRKYLCNYVDIWATSAARPFLQLLNKTTTVDDAFTSIATSASANWATWTKQSQ